MAGTRVRWSKDLLARMGSDSRSATLAVSSDLRFDRAEVCLALFVALQIVEFGLLAAQGNLDLAIAACLSTSLLSVTALFTLQRREIENVARSHLAVPAPVVAPSLIQATPVPTAHPALNEESQTWADLMARINHELRTPLNAVIGFADLMERELFGPLGNPRYCDYAAHIRQSGEALLKSAEDTLALSSLLATPSAMQRPHVSNLATLARDTWATLEPHATRRGIGIDVAMAETLDIAGDRLAHRQILMNLMLEAMSRAEAGAMIEVRGRANGDTVYVNVAVTCEQKPRVLVPSLALCIAITLLEHEGSSLIVSEHPLTRLWVASTVLDLAVQPDFFANPDTGCGQR